MSLAAYLLLLVIITLVAAQLWLCLREVSFQNTQRLRLQHQTLEPALRRQQQTEIDYAISKMDMAVISIIGHALILLIMTFGGGLSFIHTAWLSVVSSGIRAEVFTAGSIVVVSAFFLLLLTAYKQLVIDKHFGIGKISALIFARDTLITSVVLSVVAGLIVSSCTLAMVEFELWKWFGVWFVWICFDWVRSSQILRKIGHIFDDLEGLSDEVLRSRIHNLMVRSGCMVDNIEVVDSSKRSTHANASISGFGKSKRILINDTLLAVLNRDEVVAVMAHELGHVCNWHIIKDFTLRAAIAFAWIFSVGHLLEVPAVQSALNIRNASDGMLLALLWLLTPVFALLAKPLISSMRRFCEFEADHFVVCYGDPIAFMSALEKLHSRNASAREFDPLFSFVHSSHPSLKERVARLTVSCG